MLYTVSFSHIVDGQRVPLTDGGAEVAKIVEAPTKTAAMMNSEVQQFCEQSGNDTRVRRVI